MKRFTIASYAAFAALLLCRTAAAQGNAGNLNDLRLHNEGDVVFSYNDGSAPQIGIHAGEDQVNAPWLTNFLIWKTWSRDTLRHCSGVMEISGVDIGIFDSDWGTIDANGNNCANPDWWWSEQDSAGPQGAAPNSPVGTPVPDQVNGAYLVAPTATPSVVNNDFFTDPGCPPSSTQISGYEVQYDLTGGLGGGNGIGITADGTKDFMWTIFLSGGQTNGGPNSCTGTNSSDQGDYTYQDLHSTDLGANPLDGETGHDWLGTAISAFGGFDNGASATPAVGEGVAEINCNYIQFTEPTIAMNVNSNTGHLDPGTVATIWNGAATELGLEEGLAGVHYKLSGAAGGRLSARYYAWQGLGRPCEIFGALSTLPCPNFKGSKLGVNIADIIGKTLQIFWPVSLVGPVLTDNQYVSSASNFDDATYRAPPLPIPILAGLPSPTTVKLFFQGFHKKPASGLVEGSQVTTWYLHKP